MTPYSADDEDLANNNFVYPFDCTYISSYTSKDLQKYRSQGRHQRQNMGTKNETRNKRT